MPLYGGSRGRDLVQYLFVDGGCLRELVKATAERFFGGAEIELEYANVVRGYLKTFYYDAIPVLGTNSSAADRVKAEVQEALHGKLRQVDGLHVYEGDARRRRKEGLAQKMVDVKLAIDMLTHSVRGNMDRATLLTSDLDFKPLIDALNEDGLYVTLWYPRGRANPELLAAADARHEIDVQTVHGWATESFRRKYPIPNQGNELVGGYHFSGTPEAEWDDRVHGKMALWRRDGEFNVVFPQNPKQQTHFLRVWGPDLEMLRKFVDEVHGVVVPPGSY